MIHITRLQRSTRLTSIHVQYLWNVDVIFWWSSVYLIVINSSYIPPILVSQLHIALYGFNISSNEIDEFEKRVQKAKEAYDSAHDQEKHIKTHVKKITVRVVRRLRDAFDVRRNNSL